MLDTVFGLPVHPLLVHATVVTVPLAAATVPLAAVWPRFRRWAGPGPLLISLAALVLTPLSTQSGEYLEHRLPRSPAIEKHAWLGKQLLPWVAALAVLAVLGYALHRWERRTSGPNPPVQAGQPDPDRAASRAAGLAQPVALGLAALAILAGAGTAVQVARIGHSGAEASWGSVGSSDQGR